MLLEKVLELEEAYVNTFTKCEKREWGSLFYNESQPNYYDANHAVIVEPPLHPVAVLDEVATFYEEKQLVPRMYIYQAEKQEGLITALEAKGYRSELLESPFQLWNGQVTDVPLNEDVTIEEVDEQNIKDAIAVEVTIHELGGEIRRQALKEEMSIEGFTHYLLRYRGVACSTASIFHDGGQARMEGVATLAAYRGRGLIGHLIRHIQLVCQEKGYRHLWVFPITEQVGKVYAKHGFDSVGTVQTLHAFASGKSITDIRAGL